MSPDASAHSNPHVISGSLLNLFEVSNVKSRVAAWIQPNRHQLWPSVDPWTHAGEEIVLKSARLQPISASSCWASKTLRAGRRDRSADRQCVRSVGRTPRVGGKGDGGSS